MRCLFLRAALALVAMACGVAIAAEPASDPVVGTWQLNGPKSTFTAGQELESQTRTYSQSGQTITLVMKTVGTDGKDVMTHTSYQLYGNDYPVMGTPDYYSLSAQQVDSHTAKFKLKKHGEVVGTTSRTVSKDGKTLTSEMKLTTAKGEKSESKLVFDKE